MRKKSRPKKEPTKIIFDYFDWQDDRLRDEFYNYDLSKPDENKAASALALNSYRTGFLEAKQA